MNDLLWLIPAFPLLGAAVLGLLSVASARSGEGASRGLAALIGVLMPALAFAVTVAAAAGIAGPADPTHLAQTLWTWFQVGSSPVGLGFLFDRLSAFMLLFVTGIGTLICLYSVGYMWADRGFVRFQCYLNLFLFSMVMLVLGDSLPVTFLGWEGVGLCSYLLIGFWHKVDAYGDAARKAFVVNRIGDLGFILGAFILFQLTGSLNYQDIAKAIGASAGQLPVALAGLLLFIGCTGKSAQIPLVTWLPDAMAGPTPVSALIHAATMVTAGVFLVGRLGPVYVAADGWLLDVVLITGCATALWGAISGLFQHDIKKALAYSTVSQLGFMFMAAGIGRFDIALFHVFTHAFFKATLFLGAGAVIHNLHHEQDMRRMGGLRTLLPFTHAMVAWAWFAIIGGPLSSGFWSKDQILEALIGGHGLGPVVGVIALLTAFITAVYMTRMYVLTFWGPSRVKPEVRAHLHGTPVTMIIPLLILGVGSLAVGFLWFSFAFMGIESLKQTALQDWLLPALPTVAAAIAQTHHHPHWVTWVATGLAAVGVVIAVRLFAKGPKDGAPADGVSPDPTGFGGWWTWAFDRTLNRGAIVATTVAAWVVFAWDLLVSRLLMADAVAGAVSALGRVGAGFQRARLRANLLLAVIGLVVVLALLLFSGAR